MNLPKTYEPTTLEPIQYDLWSEGEGFGVGPEDGRAPFVITIPPPNVTGELHLGHALQHTIHDVLLRRRRMQGYAALCVPGTDHAGIGTQTKIEQALRAEGMTRWDLGRAAFIERARDWTLNYGGAILEQLRGLGCSYDWSRLRFTLDEFPEAGSESAHWAEGRLYTRSGYARAVLGTFLHYHEQGLIYRGERIVNWCPRCRTVVSDLEVQHHELSSRLWHIHYPAEGGGEGVVVATTRPETMLGDTGVAVSPSDGRYSRIVGTRVRLPLQDRLIPVVADHHVDASFGSGAVKITPAHDPNDWEIAQRHAELLLPPATASGLESVLAVMGDDGMMTENAGAFAGLAREEARRQVVARLTEMGLLRKVEDHVHSVGHHDRCGTVIEPLLKPQWWMRCDELATKARSAIESGRVRFAPDRFAGMALSWLEQIRPWCLSRQLWWGHRIPLWYCTDLACEPAVVWAPGEGEPRPATISAGARPVASIDRPASCPRCGNSELVQDPDVLDTWFSSALWPVAVLGGPGDSADMRRFYPTDVMITGRDILYLWVARMIMAGEEFCGSEPFRQVIIHATVMSEDGRRMSKSLGTGVDPRELIRLYGADATRLGLASLVSESQDIRFKVLWESGGKAAIGPGDRIAKAEQIEQMRNFCTKLWNVSRFAAMGLEGAEFESLPTLEQLAARTDLEVADRWILSRLEAAVVGINEALDRFAIGEAAWCLYHFVWDELADWYLELIKPRLRADDPGPVRTMLLGVLDTSLRLAHPIMPFITEAIWQTLPGVPRGAVLMRQQFPASSQELRNAGAEGQMTATMEVVRAIRNLKAELGAPQKEVDAYVMKAGEGDEIVPDYVRLMARVRWLAQRPDGEVSRCLAAGWEVVIPVDGLVDRDAESARLRRELELLEKELSGLKSRLNNESFVSRAPAEVVAKARKQSEELEQRREVLAARLATLSGAPDSPGTAA